MKKTFTVIRKWAEAKGYEVIESKYREGKVITVKYDEELSFELDNRESTIYRSIRGIAGNAAGLYLERKRKSVIRSYAFRKDSQKHAIEEMERDIADYEKALAEERKAVKKEAVMPIVADTTKPEKPAASKPARNRNLQPVMTELHKAFDLLNKHFYEGKLPEVVIAVQAKGKSKAYGWYTPYDSWKDGDTAKSEITITAEHLDRPYLEIMRTLHHEMIHHYCHTNELQDTSRQGKYHNKVFKEESEKRGFFYEGGPDKTIGWSFSKLTPETESLFNGWDLDKEVFGFARIEYGQKEKKKKGSNIVKWVCPKCGDTVRSSKTDLFIKCCRPNSDGEMCDVLFVGEFPENFTGKMTFLPDEEAVLEFILMKNDEYLKEYMDLVVSEDELIDEFRDWGAERLGAAVGGLVKKHFLLVDEDVISMTEQSMKHFNVGKEYDDEKDAK